MTWAYFPREAVENSLLILYNRQTQFEKSLGRTVERNGEGFDASDAVVLSRYAKYLLQFGYLGAPQIEFAKQRLWKYRHQLLRLGVISDDMINPEKAPKQLALEV